MTARRDSTDATYPDCSTTRQRTRAEVAHGHGGGGSAGPAGHGAPHGRDHSHRVATRGLEGALALTAVFLVAEVVGGLLSNSLSLLADAGHMLTDVGALAFSLFVTWLSRQRAAPEKSYGYLRWEILAALLNGATLLVISAVIIWEAVLRIRAPEPIETGVMLGVALGGLVVNVIAAKMLHAGAGHSLNVRGAYLHVVSDLLGSVAVVIAALAIRFKGWNLADPIASIVMTALIVRGSWSLVRESVDVLLEATPAHIDLAAVRSALERIPAVESVHDLHVWTLTSGVVAMSAHSVVPDPARHQEVLEAMNRVVATHGIHHVTIQLEDRTLEECAPDAGHLH